MYLSSMSLSLISFIIVGLGGRFYGRVVSAYLSTLLIFMSFCCSVFIWYEVCLSCAPVSLHLYTWLNFGFCVINIGFLFDFLTCTMLFVMTSISFFVHLYSMGYLWNDPFLTSFMAYLSFFTFWMLILVSADNFLQMFIGWEGVGLCSYLLMNFWFTRFLANKAALKAMIINSMADVFFILAIVMLFFLFKTTDYIVMFHLMPYVGFLNFDIFMFKGMELINILLLMGAFGKSAQMGLHVWLPDAMEGPTPVSALLHAATMVTAGVFLVISCAPLFEYTPKMLLILVLMGGLTAFMMSLVAVCQYDIKKVIAYSTCSQLGYMFFSCGYSQYNIALFHLYNHAFFKALLFLGAGSMMHACFDEQDMRYYGGLLNFMPFTYMCMLMGSLAMMGFPFLTGFYSKDLILELSLSSYIMDAYFIYFLAVLAAMNTTIYSWRILFFVFYRSTNINNFSMNEQNIYMCCSLFFLSFFSIFMGYMSSEIMMGFGMYMYNFSYFMLPWNFNSFESEFLSSFYKNLPLLMSFCGFFFGQSLVFMMDHKKFLMNSFFVMYLNKFFSIFYYGFFFNIIYNYLFLVLYKSSYILISKSLDKGSLEFSGPYGLYKLFLNLSYKFRFFMPSSMTLNLFFMFLYMVIIFWFLFYCHININFCILMSMIFFFELKV